MPDLIGYPRSVRPDDAELVVRSLALLEEGRTYRRARENMWLQSERQYLGDHWSQTDMEDTTADLIVVNVSFSTVNTIVPYVTSEEPSFLVEPYSLDATATNARLQQGWLNRTWRSWDSGAQSAIEASAEDAIIYGDGYLSVNYALEEKRRSDENVSDATVAKIRINSVSPWDVWVDPTARSMRDARWVAIKTVLTKRELGKVEVLDEDGETVPLAGSALLEQLPSGLGFEADERERRGIHITTGFAPEEEWVTVIDFYDLIDSLFLRIVDGHELPLTIVEGARPPIVQIAGYRIPNSPYHMGDLEQIWPIQQELNKARSQLATHRKRNTVKVLVREGAIDNDAQQALASPRTGEFVKLKTNEPLDSVVKPISLQPLAAEVYNASDLSLRDVYEITGVNEYLRGATPEIRRTATEASIIEGASNVKTRAKLARIERAVREAGILMLGIAREVFPLTDFDEMGMRLGGEEADRYNRAAVAEGADPSVIGQDVDFQPSAEMFVGEYEVNVETSSTELRNPVFREQKYREMFQVLLQSGQVLPQMGVQVNIQRVLELWLEAAGITDVEGIVAAAQPPPQAGLPPGGPPGGPQGAPAGPNLDAAAAPLAPITEGNSGQLAPA